MNQESLRQFLVDSNKARYAGGEEKKWIKESDGSTTIPFQIYRADYLGGLVNQREGV